MRAAIFDFDGVLVDSEPLHYACLRDALSAEGVAIDKDEYQRVYLAYDDRGAIRLAFETHGVAFDLARLERVARRKAALFEQRLPEIRFFPGAKDFVRRVSDALPVAIASGALSSEIEAILSAGGLRDAFVAVVGADHVSRGKPDPEPYVTAMRQLGGLAPALQADECLVVEDSMPGIAAARAAGMKVVGVTNSYPATKLAAAHRVVDTLEGLTLEALVDLFPTEATP